MTAASGEGNVETTLDGDELFIGTDDPTGTPVDAVWTPATQAKYTENRGYRLSVSVASDDLIVALKNMAGNDPTAAAPVIVRIGNTIHVITAALSVTAADATNWCNAGGSELATKEVGYFAYLGYNATDGVVIGFSRISSARKYSDFSATSTNEAFCKISDISNAAASDAYENIGYFHAILSAGAGYTWTLPATTITVNRPVYESDWLEWTPAYSASGSLTYTSVSTTHAKYKVGLDGIDYNLKAAGTLGGTASTALYATVPFDAALSANSVICGYGNTAGVVGSAFITAGTPDKFSIVKYDASNYATSGSCTISIGGEYEI